MTRTYDATNQLTSQRRSSAWAYDQADTYDALGTRPLEDASGALTTSMYDLANQLVTSQHAAGATTYTHDLAGNLHIVEQPTGQRTTTTWDDQKRQTGVLLPDGSAVTNTYRFDGLRYSKQEPQATTKFRWDVNNYLAETNDQDDIQAVYTNEPQQYGNLISQYRKDGAIWTPRYFQFDALGSTRILTDDDGEATDVYLYDAWGNQLAVSGSTVNPFRWIGRVGYYWDESNGRFYIRARVYEPVIGRWMSQDPLFFPVPSAVQLSDYLNFTGLYQYIAARVLNVTDPSGTLAPNSADNRIDTHGDAQLACAQAWLDRLDRDTTPLPPFSAAVRNKCSMDILNVTLTSERLRQLGTYFDFWENAWKPPRCEFPAICCACCRWAGQYNRSDHAIFVCANNVRTPLEIETVLLHELTHALQSCYPYQASSPCELSIKRELEAYSCAGQCDRTFGNCLSRAMGSSCGSGACTSQDWNQTFFQKIENWYRDNKAGFCTPGGRGQATKRVNIHDCRVLRGKHGL